MGVRAGMQVVGRRVVGLVGRLGGRGNRLPVSQIRNFLVVQHGAALGTVVHGTPLIEALRDALPTSRIVVVASGASREIYRGNPHVERMVETPDPTKDLWGAIWVLRRARPFAGEEFCVLTPLGNERTMVALQAVLGAPGGIRVGFTVAPELFEVALRFDRKLSQIANNLRLVEALGHPVRHFEPRVHFSGADVGFALRRLEEAGVREGQRVVVFVTQTSVTQRKAWRAERFRAAARFAWERFGAFVVFVGTAGEGAAIEALREGLEGPHASFAGRTNLMQLSALLSVADAGLTLDTGTMHLGRAVGLPMVIVAPAWSPAVEWLPVGDPRFRILKNLEMDAVPGGYAIDEVSVEEVTAALSEMLKGTQRSARRSR